MRRASPLFAFLTLAVGALAKIQYLGVAIAGIDFGCDIEGSCPIETDSFPLSEYGGGDGKGQMEHFRENSGVNVFRLSLTWQYLCGDNAGNDFDSEKMGHFDKLVQTCLDTGAYCMIDLHNFARFDGGIIGQGGPSDEVFANFWSQMAKFYAKNDKIIFGLMNEPHDLDIDLWADSCQAAVTAIRKAGATSQMILLPGTNFASAETFVSTGSAEALAAIKNPDGSKDGLLLDLHKYLDINNSGTHEECTTDNVEGFGTIATWLRKNKREAIISETGASQSSSCVKKFCAQNKFINENTDVFIGFVGWGAGSFDTDYIMSLTPTGSTGSYTDNKLMKECIVNVFGKDAKPDDDDDNETDTETATATSLVTKTRTSAPSMTTDGSLFQEKADSSSTPTEAPASTASSSEDNSACGRGIQSLGGGLILAMFTAYYTGLRWL